MAVQVTPYNKIISGNPVKKNNGTILGAGTTTTNNLDGQRKFTNFSLIQNNNNPSRLQGAIIAKHAYGTTFILWGTGVAISSLTQSSSTGFCKITKSSHGLTVGTQIQVSGTSVKNYNVLHTVTSVIDANNVQTDIAYTSNAGTPGSYYPINGTYGKVTRNRYTASLIGKYTAGVSNLFLVGMSNAQMKAYNESRGDYGVQITGYDYFTGTVTKGANWGVQNKFHDIANNNQDLAFEPHPTLAIPGFLIFKTGALVPVQKFYTKKTH